MEKYYRECRDCLTKTLSVLRKSFTTEKLGNDHTIGTTIENVIYHGAFVTWSFVALHNTTHITNTTRPFI